MVLKPQAAAGPATSIPPPEAEAEDEGPWDAADSAFTDDLFRTGCFLFTQFYKERTKEIRCVVAATQV